VAHDVVMVCPIFCTIDKGEGVVKGKDFLTAAMSNAGRRFGDRSLHRNFIESTWVEISSTNHRYGHIRRP
jgi:hypothetical protein